MSNFKPFGSAVNRRFTAMSAYELFVVDIDPNDLWDAYLEAFPPGTNEIYRTRREFDCSCCKNFVRNLGMVVTVDEEGKVGTIWDIEGLEHPFNVVAETLDTLVKSRAVSGVFRTKMSSYGVERTREVLANGDVHGWDHFWGDIDKKHRSDSPAEKAGELNSAAAVFDRGLRELNTASIDEVLSLIEQNALYRGEEHKAAVLGFRKLKQQFEDAGRPRNFAWGNLHARGARFRNTVIGTLVQDLSEGVELEAAVRSFEVKVAPTNYKRTTALITPRMISDAMKTVEELGIEPALKRRLANIGDVSINNVLWADRDDRALMRDSLTSVLMSAAAPSKSNEKSRDITIDEFMATVLPTAINMDMHVLNEHSANFVTITTEAEAGSRRLFKWDNPFAWAYDGNITDSIREKVKKAGGNVEAKLRFSLAWHNYDDLDIHVTTPEGLIWYMVKRNRLGTLDVDMNAGVGRSREPVENVALHTVPDGVYTVKVNCYNKREVTDGGFTVEVACGADVRQYSTAKGLRNAESMMIGSFETRGGAIIKSSVNEALTGEGISQEKWGVQTEKKVKVRTVLLSPNHWDGQAVGNKHWIFVLDGCKVGEPMRGIFNEFLDDRLTKHRKVFEILGDKTKCQPAVEQLSGLGFSSTRHDTVKVSVTTDKGTAAYTVRF